MKRILTACCFAACLIPSSILPAQQVRIVAMTGDPMPRGDGVFTGFGRAVLGDSGEVAFEGVGQLTGSSTPDSMRGIYSGNGISPLRAVAQVGDLAPNNRPIGTPSYPAINASGQIAYNARVFGRMSYLVEDQDVVVNWVSNGNPRSDGPGQMAVSEWERPHLTNTGTLTFRDRAIVPFPDNNTRLGIFQTQGNITSTIARDNELTPDGALRWTFAPGSQADVPFSVNNLGQVALLSRVREIDSGAFHNGLFLVHGGSVSEIEIAGTPAPNGDGVIGAPAFSVSINDSSAIAFTAGLTGTAEGSSSTMGVFRLSGSEIVELARTGDPAPVGPGTLVSFRDLQQNARGQVLAEATYTGNAFGQNMGLILIDDSGTQDVVRLNGPLHDGSGYYTQLFLSAINDHGQVAFEATITASPTGHSVRENGIFLYDDGVTQTIATSGQSYLGSTITDLALLTDSVSDIENRYVFPSRKPLNNLGQVAYRFTLADGREGIAVWSVPEVPTSFVACIALLAFVAIRFRNVPDHSTNGER